MTRDDLLGSCSAAAATIVIGSSVAASSVIVDYPVFGGQAVRYALGGLALAAVLRTRRRLLPRLSWREAGLLLALALTGLVGFNLFLLAALREAEPAAAGVVVGCVPVVLALAGPFARRRAPSHRVLAAAIVVAAGAAVVQGAGETTARGFVWALGALAGEAAFSLLAVPLLPRLGPLALSTYLCVLASALFAGAAAVVDGTAALPVPSLAEAVAIGYLGVLVTAGAFVVWYGGVARIGVERAGLFAGLIPLGALFAALLVGTGTITPLRLLGAVVVGAGVVVGISAGDGGPTRAPRWRRR